MRKPNKQETKARIQNTRIHNLSSIKLSQDQKELLGHGLNFRLTPSPCDQKEILNAFTQLSMTMRKRWYMHSKTQNIQNTEVNTGGNNNNHSIRKKLQLEKRKWNPLDREDFPYNHSLDTYIFAINHYIREEIEKNQYKKIHRNMNSQLHNAMKSLKNNKHIIIRNSDKNIGTVIVDKEWYMKEAERHLSNPNNYRKATVEEKKNEEQRFITSLQRTLKKLGIPNDNVIHNFLMKNTTDKNHTPIFHLLPRVHKLNHEDLTLPKKELYKKLTGRPIAGAHSYLTTNTSKLLSYILNHSVCQIPHILKNIHQLTHALDITTFPHTEQHKHTIDHEKKLFLFCADVENLYPNIPTDKSYHKGMKDLYTPHPGFPHMKWEDICDLLDSIFENSFVEFNNEIFQQVNGLTMGTPVAPPFANLFMYSLEKPVIEKWKANLITLFRFLDDIHGIFYGTEKDFNTFKDAYSNLHPKIKLTWNVSHKEITFMDITIYIPDNFHITGKLGYKVYQKPLNAYLYIPYNSYIPLSTFRGFIKGELIRYIRLSSTIQDFSDIKKKFFKRLLERGYKQQFLIPIFNSVLFKNKEQHHIKKHNEENNSNNKSPPLILSIPYNPQTNNINMKKILQEHWNIIENNKELRSLFTKLPMIAYSNKQSTSLRTILAPSNIFKTNNLGK